MGIIFALFAAKKKRIKNISLRKNVGLFGSVF